MSPLDALVVILVACGAALLLGAFACMEAEAEVGA